MQRATGEDLKMANKVIEVALQGSDLQITFKNRLVVLQMKKATRANREGSFTVFVEQRYKQKHMHSRWQLSMEID